MTITNIQAKSILRKHKRVDSWFVSRYGMNLYRGCLHDCTYCDGRADVYQVAGEFGRDVAVKENAIEILLKELDPARKRVPLKKAYIMLGGGVGDCYQALDKKYQLSRQALGLIHHFGFPVHILTKSTLVQRDIDLICSINEKNRAIVSMSFSSVDEEKSAVFEPNVPSPEKRLNVLAEFKSQGIACGMFLMPVIPFITDTPELIEASISKAVETGLDFIVFSGMTLKPGRQWDYFISKVNQDYPEQVKDILSIYAEADRWGNALSQYYDQLQQMFCKIAGRYKIPVRMPPALFTDILDENDRVIVMLEHIDYMLKIQNAKSPYGYAAYSLSQLKESISSIKGKLTSLKGVGPATERLILEILETGRSDLYEKLLL